MTPVFRLEYFIVAAANGTPCDLEPIFNEEKYLHAIAGASVDLPMPIGRTQEYLAKLAGMDVEIPDKPIYRTEYYLAHMIDSTVECPAPIFREEMFYYEWASNEYETVTGNPVSFTAKAAPLRKLEVAFSPVQDLHGYDAPWPAGGGVNKWDEEWEEGLISTSSGTPQPATGYIRSKNFCPCESDTEYYVTITNGLGGLKFFFYDENEAFLSSPTVVSNATITTPNNAKFFKLETWSAYYGGEYRNDIAVNYPATVTTYSPYSNLCPISGWSSVTAEQRGKNLWNADISSDGQNIDKLTYVGQASGYAVYSFPVPANTQMRVKAITLSSLTSAILIQSTKNGADYGNAVSISQLAWAHERVLTSNSDGVLYLLTNTSPQQTITAVSESQVEIEVGTQEIAAYTPYVSGTTISVTFPDSVYSGTLDVVTGVVTVDKTTVPITADMIYNYNASRNAFTVYRTAVSNVWKMDGEIGSTYSFSHGIVVAKNNQFAGVTNGACCGSTVAGNQEFLFVKLANNFSDLDTAKAYVTEQANNGTPLQVCYYLATPQTFQLTTQEVLALVGANNVWSDSNGDVTVTYRSN